MAGKIGAALITGGSGALAQAIAKTFCAAGWVVAAPGRRELDVRCAEHVRKYVAAQKELDLLVHCAAVKRDAPISMITEADWDAVLATDVGGAFRMAQAVQPLLQRSAQGHAVFIGSYSALSGPAGQCAYAASKAALLGFSRSLAREWAPHGIRVNAILPGWLETKFTADVAPEIAESVRQQHLLGKFNSVEDVAAFLLALQSLLAISGQIFQLDSRVHPGF